MNVNDIRVKDIITLGDDRRFLVLSTTEYNNEKYFYLVNNQDEKISAMFVKLDGSSFHEIEDEETLKMIAPSLKDGSMELLKELKIEMLTKGD